MKIYEMKTQKKLKMEVLKKKKKKKLRMVYL